MLYTVRPDGSRLTPLPDSEGTAANHASWSPDGRRLLFCFVPSGQAHGADLAVIGRDGTGMRLLAHTALNENGAFWGVAPPPSSRG